MNNLLQWFLTCRMRINTGMVAVLLAGFLLCMAVSDSWTRWQRIHSSSVLLASKTPVSVVSVVSTEGLAGRHLFGMRLMQGAGTLPQTHLQLELTGIMGATPASESRAVISVVRGQPGQIYRVGDTLPSLGVRVHAITQEAVVLENGGHVERLMLERSPLRFEQISRSFLGG